MKTKILTKMIDKVNDEFIVDCTNNSKEERQQVYKFLVDNRNYEESYLNANYPIIVCNKQSGTSKWTSLKAYYDWNFCKKDLLVYTFEQFKKYVLKQETMEKEIIGYKTPYDMYGGQVKKGDIWTLNRYDNGYQSNANVTDLPKEIVEQWEKVYKEEFQVGDWVALKSNNKEIGQITKITGYICWGKRYTSFPEYLRKATQEEIEKATEQTVSMNGKFNLTVKDKKVFHKNEDITSFVEGIGGLYDNRVLKRNFGIKNYDFHVKDMILSKTGCESQETYLSDWLKVYDLIK